MIAEIFLPMGSTCGKCEIGLKNGLRERFSDLRVNGTRTSAFPTP